MVRGGGGFARRLADGNVTMGGKGPETDRQAIVDYIRAWHGIVPPDPVALAFAEDIAKIIAAFEALEPAPFEGEPSDFLDVLEAFAERRAGRDPAASGK